jgi:hypothetical protein
MPQWLGLELHDDCEPVVKLAFISALVFEISQLQSAQDRVVLARTNAIIVRSEHYELVAMRDPGPQKSLACIDAMVLRKFCEIFRIV